MNGAETADCWASHVEAVFFRDGFVAPVKLLAPAQCALFVQHLRHDVPLPPKEWAKGSAASDRFFYNYATAPKLIAALRPLLGEDFVLWGASVVERDRGQVHPWHCDVESAQPGKRFVSVWIGLENTCRESALQLVSRSHAFGKPVQQVLAEKGVARGSASSDMILAWAREFDQRATLVQPEMTDGDAILFDGNLWHASNNAGHSGSRVALLLQYASADTEVRIPAEYAWPFRYIDKRPPVIVVHGRGDHEANRLVPPPSACPEGSGVLTTPIRHIETPPDGDASKRWRSYPMFCGSTPLIGCMECHVSVLREGCSPHLPHAHADEELLIVLDGHAELLLNDRPTFEGARCELVASNAIAYYPAYSHHTLRNIGPVPTRYLMLKWRGAAAGAGSSAVAEVNRVCIEGSPPAPFESRVIFEHATSYLNKLHAHLSILQPGAGYEAHVDDYDVAIILLSGTIETLGQRIEPQSVIYYAAGEPHGLKNVGNETARYLVFEFHAPKRWLTSQKLFPLAQSTSGDQSIERAPQDIRTFWIGPPLSAYEELCLVSFVARRQRVLLYSYDADLKVPDGVTLVDAREVLPGAHIHEFVRPSGEVVPTPHANLFRYEALRRFGGWYCDLDVVLIGGQPPQADIYIANEGGGIVNCAIMRFQPDEPLLEEAVEGARGLMSQAEWGASGPKLITRLIQKYGLEHLVQPASAAYPVSPADARKLFLPEFHEEMEYQVAGADFLHLWNQIWRSVRIPKEYGPPEGSFLDSLFKEFGIRIPPNGRLSAAAVAHWFEEFDYLQNVDGRSVEDLKRALDAAVWERDQLLQSTSWRMTAPLRALVDALFRSAGRSR